MLKAGLVLQLNMTLCGGRFYASTQSEAKQNELILTGSLD